MRKHVPSRGVTVRTLLARPLWGPATDDLRGAEVLAAPLPDALDGGRPGVRALVPVGDRVDARLLDLLPDLALVANFGVGVDNVDLAECAGRGVAVTNTPGVVDAATADLAFALLLAVSRRLVEADAWVREGRWPREGTGALLARDVGGATLGIVGLGRIGRAVARRARGFDMRVLYAQRTRYDPELERELGVEHRELDTLLAEADAVTLHVPLTEATRGLLDARRLALLRDGARLVNTARGPIVDEPALVAELVSGRIAAGLDVFAEEPRVAEELLGLPNVVLAPHVGTLTVETRSRMTRLVVDNVLAFEAGRPLLTPVTPSSPRGSAPPPPG
jgi:glyoxylate reductase